MPAGHTDFQCFWQNYNAYV